MYSNLGFSDDYDYQLIDEISSCYVNKTKDSCDKKTPLCAFSTSDNVCQLVLPKKNLVSKIDNETYYYGKMADELIRYSRIKSFMFEPEKYFSVGEVGYHLRDNDIILIQSLLTQEYFDDLIPV